MSLPLALTLIEEIVEGVTPDGGDPFTRCGDGAGSTMSLDYLEAPPRDRIFDVRTSAPIDDGESGVTSRRKRCDVTIRLIYQRGSGSDLIALDRRAAADVGQIVDAMENPGSWAGQAGIETLYSEGEALGVVGDARLIVSIPLTLLYR